MHILFYGGMLGIEKGFRPEEAVWLLLQRETRKAIRTVMLKFTTDNPIQKWVGMIAKIGPIEIGFIDEYLWQLWPRNGSPRYIVRFRPQTWPETFWWRNISWNSSTKDDCATGNPKRSFKSGNMSFLVSLSSKSFPSNAWLLRWLSFRRLGTSLPFYNV